MKISKLFHWLYAAIMFLPLLVAPIFAIYSHRHTIDSYSVTREKYQVVDFNQQLPLLEENKGYTELGYNSTFTFDDGTLEIQPFNVIGDVGNPTFGRFIQNNTYVIRFDFMSSVAYLYAEIYSGSQGWIINNGYDNVNNWSHYSVLFSVQSGTCFDIYTNGGYIKNYQQFNLTQMFGEGNEPTINEFNQMFPNEYYEYTTSKKVLIQNGNETLNNTDIGSQFIYTIYNPLNDYFNFNKYLGIGNLYNWLQLNLFEGTAPLGFFIFWELLMYWLLISLIWLIFDVAMYVPKLAHRWLDKASLE